MEKDSRKENYIFYNNKKVLITGHTGFKGAWMTGILNYLGARSVGYALRPEKGCLYEQMNGDSIIQSVIGDLGDYSLLKSTIMDFQPEIIIHLAAYGFMNECFNNPRRAYASNVLGTVNLLEVIRECETVKSVVIVSTDKVYANKGDGAVYTELDRLGGQSPYSCSKTCMELIVKDYYDTYFCPSERQIGIGVVRASNVLAGGDHIQTRLIPSILRSIDEGNPVELRNPNQTRPWQSVLDALDGYLTVGRYLYENPTEYSEAWNIGPVKDGIKSVAWVFDKIRFYFQGLEQSKAEQFDVHESETLGLDIAKAITKLDWTPKLTIDKVIEQVVNFYKGQKEGIDVLSLCQSQIKEYYGGSNCEVE